MGTFGIPLDKQIFAFTSSVRVLRLILIVLARVVWLLYDGAWRTLINVVLNLWVGIVICQSYGPRERINRTGINYVCYICLTTSR